MAEAPFVDTLMKLGMGKGPALALLLTGPGLSLPNWLAIAKVFGIKKALVYVPTIVVLGTLVGWFFGNFILRLRQFPVGVKLCQRAEELNDGKIPSEKLTFCQMIKLAGQGKWQLAYLRI
jgi:hypothetical protein